MFFYTYHCSIFPFSRTKEREIVDLSDPESPEAANVAGQGVGLLLEVNGVEAAVEEGKVAGGRRKRPLRHQRLILGVHPRLVCVVLQHFERRDH